MAILLLAVALFGVTEREIPVKVEPPQTITAVTLSSGDEIRSFAVQDGKIRVGDDFALPWKVGLTRFEQTIYTQTDLQQSRALLLRELGTLRGTVTPATPHDETWTLLLVRSGSTTATATRFVTYENGAFSLRVPAGLYAGAVIGTTRGSRIRSGIILNPGAVTELGVMTCEPTVTATVRVIDAKRGGPVSAASVQWDPPAALNSAVASVLYSRLWSTVTDARGVATFPSIGPVPIPVRWRISAKGYAAAWTSQVISENHRAVLPDARLRAEVVLTVRVRLPRDASMLRGAAVMIGEPEGSRSARFVAAARAPLQDGELRFALTSYGRKRVMIQSAAGKPLTYRDINVDSDAFLDLALEPFEIHGTVTRHDKPVAGALVTLADPQDARVILAQARVDDRGKYSLTTFQSGDLFLYTIETHGSPGATAGTVSKSIHAGDRTDYELDFDLPEFGVAIRVVDALTNTPIRASIDKRIELTNGARVLGLEETDEKGRLSLTGYPEGTASLHVAAKRYRAADLTVPLRTDPGELLIQLQPAPAIAGRVVDERGAPVSGARVTGGYSDETAMQPYFIALTNANGEFRFESAPEDGTTLYAAAAGHSLGIATMQSGGSNTIVLHSPNSSRVTVVVDHAPPQGRQLVTAVPLNGRMIPFAALDDVAEANGMTSFQLLGCTNDGAVILQEFLPPGAYELFLAEPGQTRFTYRRAGSIRLPADRNVVLASTTR